MVFNHTSRDFTLAAAISGAGTMRQIAGTTILSGASGAFTGPTAITGGTLLVNGTLGGTITVTGGTLGGTGTIAGPVVINAGGTLAAACARFCRDVVHVCFLARALVRAASLLHYANPIRL